MSTMSARRRTATRLAGSISLMALLAACAVTPEPFTQAQFETKAAQDRTEMFAGQTAMTGPLSFSEAVARVLKYNLDRRSKMMEEALAMGQLDLDRYDLLPKLAANAGYAVRSEPNATVSRDLVTQTTGTGNPTYSADRDLITADLGLTWNVLDFGVSYYTAQQNADRALLMSERRRKTMSAIVQEVRFSYWRSAAAQILRDRVQSTVVRAERALADVENVERERLRDPAEALRMQKILLENVRQLEAIEQELVSAKAELAALVNLPPGSDFAVVVPADLVPPTWSIPVEQMEIKALANNADLREQDYLSRIAVDETRKEILKLLPGVTFSLSRQYDSNSFLAANRWNEGGARLTWNLLNLLSGPDRINHAETGETVANARRLALRMAVLAQVYVSANQFDAAAKQFQRADRLWSVESRLAELSGRQSRNGVQSEVESIANETSAIAAELRRYQTYAQLQSAYGKLQTTIGDDTIPEHVASQDIPTIADAVDGHLTALRNGMLATPWTSAPDKAEPEAAATVAAEQTAPNEEGGLRGMVQWLSSMLSAPSAQSYQ